MTALLLTALLAVPTDSLGTCPGGDVIARAELQAAGATAVHDILRLASAVEGITTDGFDLWPVAAAGVPFETPVQVLVDGAPVLRGGGPEPLGLEALPIAVAEIDHVVVCPGAGLAAGALGGPWIDVRTSAPAEAALVAIGFGNETGDPGPLRYLDPTLPNVDKWGPDYEFAAVTDDGRAWLATRDRGFLPTDPRIFDRTLPATNRFPNRSGTVITAAGGDARWRVRGGVRRMFDLPFVPAVRSEVPLDHVSAQATVSGRGQIGRARIQGHGHLGHVRLDRPLRSRVDLDPSWSDVRLDGALSASVDGRHQSIAAGVRMRHADASAPAFGATVTTAQGWVRAASRGPTGVAMVVGGTAAGGTLGPVGILDGWWQRGPLRLAVTASTRRTLPEDAWTHDLWRERGYGAVGPASVDAPGHSARLRGSATLRRGASRWSAAAEVLRDRETLASGAVAAGSAASLSARWRWSDARWALSTGAAARGAVAGSDAYRDLWDRLASGTAFASVAVRPDRRLSLWSRVEARSAATWSGFPEPEVPAAVRLDLGASRWFWREHLRLSITGRNVLNAEERTHPLGAVLEPRLFVRLEARL
ncbi:MAG: hypothetical protein AAGK21_06370 [Bacteroidota bacterium]